jgi:glutaredoxin 3
MNKVKIYSTALCPYCIRAKQLLDSQGIVYEEIRVDIDKAIRNEMERLSQRRTVPQIFIGDQHVGGFDDLKALYDKGELFHWLER